MNRLQKLELLWLGKDKEVRIEPRILIEDANKSVKNFGEFGNLLIHGDNLLALKALENDYSRKIKCIYIDPPYNTGAAFENYDDNKEHSIWLDLMYERVKILHSLLSDDGSLWVQIDDNEQAYLKVILDEIFGRTNYINMISIKTKTSSGASGGGEDKKLKKNIEYILVYSKNKEMCNFAFPKGMTPLKDIIEEKKLEGKSYEYNQVLISKGDKVYYKSILDGKGEEIKIFIHKNVKIESIKSLAEKENLNEEETYTKYFNNVFRKTNAQTSIRSRVNEAVKDSYDLLSIEYKPSTGKNRNEITTKYFIKSDLVVWLSDTAIVKKNIVFKLEKIGTLWDDLSWTGIAKEGGVKFNSGKKPETLIKRILEMATSPGELVLDSFLGSGTTAAVAHKMERRWIGIEMGEQAYTHCKVRLDKVIDGTDQGGISKAVNWKGGGSYRFYELAPTLIKKDSFGQEIINPEYNAEMLASAVAKHEGYFFNPHENIYWKQSKTNENSYLFVTTRHLSRELMESISQSMAEGEFLLIVCRSYDATAEKSFKNIKVKKIPQTLLKNCEFDVENYNLNIVNPPVYQEDVMEDDYTVEGASENE
jgi:adenine-specific DNA-methyltransferase